MAGRLADAQESGSAGGEACNRAGFALSNEAFAVSSGLSDNRPTTNGGLAGLNLSSALRRRDREFRLGVVSWGRSGGNVRPQTYLFAAHVAWLPRLRVGKPGHISPNSGCAGGRSRALWRLAALATVLPLLPLAQIKLHAQQQPWQGSPQYGQYPQNQYPTQTQYPQNAPYNGPYSTNQQQGYGQPGYAQPQPYAQQPYAQQPYAQQPHAGQDYADAGPGAPQQGFEQAQGPAQSFTAEQLGQLLAPIALYPDALLAQVLAAATYPAQVAVASQWLQTQGNASPEQIAAGADAQNWDPSVKALTAFPQVLAQMDQDLAWTTDLGNAYYNQPQDVLQTAQVMRQRAQAAGNLQNTPQEAVTYDRGNIEVAPVNPEQVSVPQYNPWNVYGDRVSPYPGFSLLGSLESLAGSAPVRFGAQIATAAFSHTGFGWVSWALDWLSNSILFNHSNYSSQSTSVARWGSPGGSMPGGGAWAGQTWQQQGYDQGQINQPRGNYGWQGNGYYGYNGAGGQQRDREFNRQSGRYPVRPGYGNGYGSGFENRNDNRYGNEYGSNVRRAWRGLGNTPPIQRPEGTMPGRSQQSYAPQSYARPGYGSGFYGRTDQAYGGRPGSIYGSPQQNWRGASSAPQRGDYGQRAYSGQPGRGLDGYSGKSQHSGGFHLFGGGHSSSHSFSAPHYSSPKPPKNSGGGKHGGGGGGGHSSSHGGWGHHH